jgi:hypothetical protein
MFDSDGLAPEDAAIEASGNPGAANAIFRFLEPGYRFLLKWAPVFFTPALVTLGRDFQSDVRAFFCVAF